jgi:hypothetical protein
MTDERRGFQRLNLVRPLDGWFGDYSVQLVEVSAKGALMQAEEEIPLRSRALLRFWWRDTELEIVAETVRRMHDRTGVHFTEANEQLMSLIADSARELLRAQEANAAGDRAHNVIADQTLTSASESFRGIGYVTWVLKPDGWKQRPSLLPDQPPDGFTISATEPEEQVEILCRTYEAGDTEARRLTRMLAEISVASR